MAETKIFRYPKNYEELYKWTVADVKTLIRGGCEILATHGITITPEIEADIAALISVAGKLAIESDRYLQGISTNMN